MGVGQGLALVATTKPKARTRRGITNCKTTRHKILQETTTHAVHDTGGVYHQLLRYAIYYTRGVASHTNFDDAVAAGQMQQPGPHLSTRKQSTRKLSYKNSFKDTTLTKVYQTTIFDCETMTSSGHCWQTIDSIVGKQNCDLQKNSSTIRSGTACSTRGQ